MPVFTANIPCALKVGDRIEIGGKIKENARKMSVNLCAQEGEEPRDVVLHFDVRFHRDNIISLSRKNGIWIGSGNYDTNYNMFVPGTIFRIIFEIKDTDVITIYCQGKFHSNFLPKIPLTMARYIVAWADVERVTHCYFHFANKSAETKQSVYRVPSRRSHRAPQCSREISKDGNIPSFPVAGSLAECVEERHADKQPSNKQEGKMLRTPSVNWPHVQKCCSDKIFKDWLRVVLGVDLKVNFATGLKPNSIQKYLL
ncbi:uncharacterized protein LOC113499808 isoform X3 [Trichoplusia ni]|uniref:Galectin n=1 Tax=Trichoplusia ni TaxID=7111 RepID=A0A7E5W6B5_TRINI|nr:uncharacterized protein LOC113499808 isoform X3 [Trichoplusia ni]